MKRYFTACFGKVSTFIKLNLLRMWLSVEKNILITQKLASNYTEEKIQILKKVLRK